MKEWKSVIIFLLVVGIIVLISYFAYKDGYVKPVTSNNTSNTTIVANTTKSNQSTSKTNENKATQNNTSSDENEVNTKTDTTLKNDEKTNETEKEPVENDKKEYVGKEETTVENKENNISKEDKAIETVKNVWWGDSSASFTVDHSDNHLAENEIMVKVTLDGATWWYVVNTDTWTADDSAY